MTYRTQAVLLAAMLASSSATTNAQALSVSKTQDLAGSPAATWAVIAD